MTKNKKTIVALVLNCAIILLEIIGAILSLQRHGWSAFLYYTEISNYSTLIISVLFVIFGIITLVKHTHIPHIITILRYISTTMLTITIIVVVFVLIPLRPQNALFMLFGNSNLYQHLLCPVISVVSFFIFEKDQKLLHRNICYALIPTLLYGTIMLTLNFLKVVEGPYPFLQVYEFPTHKLIVTLIVVLAMSTLISWLSLKIFNNTKITKSR
ncbi:MAG: hypothetical protein E7356_03995 [Clostridiales bacterium]|nr:hypothetical protein [Clostridiales bacterium]